MDGIDIVDVATPNRSHTPAVLAALSHGKHVLCEKPLAVTTAEVRQIAAAAKAAKKTVMTGQNMRWGARSQAIKGYVYAGALGFDANLLHLAPSTPCAAHLDPRPAATTSSTTPSAAAGPCMDIGVHALRPSGCG